MDPLVGGGDADATAGAGAEGGPAGAGIRIATINVTKATRARLDEILRECADEHVVLLQELRLHAEVCDWVAALARAHGWRVALSAPSPLDALGRHQPGQTAVLWRRTAERVAVSRGSGAQSHRHIMLHFPGVVITSVYGPQARPDMEWLDAVLTRCSEEAGERAAVACGD